eukprot:gnl/Spiro4/1989_TR950_c0_g1_i1.p2 gnl/Spiro4/1989_TR950_c0_g1~~gnl/Spiro4/1989_TR950_c0_g1_i1.p2  ORF type:complete len:115 (+),score=10.83 gnl/Spiro4/1989_TR950_c0_g1_i1:51-347(+)
MQRETSASSARRSSSLLGLLRLLDHALAPGNAQRLVFGHFGRDRRGGLEFADVERILPLPSHRISARDSLLIAADNFQILLELFLRHFSDVVAPCTLR